jgi:D-glycero-D-manno-heptose 1,7-bisphosphate phosphatase
MLVAEAGEPVCFTCEMADHPYLVDTAPGGILRFLFTRPTDVVGRRAIFLDRDGVINQRRLGGYVSDLSQFRFLSGATEGLIELSSFPGPIIVISNQAGVGKGLIQASALEEITVGFVGAITHFGGRIDGVYYCPHEPAAGCACRKPRPGLLLQARQDWRIEMGLSVFFGDAMTDVDAGIAAGCRTVLVRSLDRPIAEPELPTTTRVIENLEAAVATVAQLSGERLRSL